jgi:outer membrane protein assembly factor BamA
MDDLRHMADTLRRERGQRLAWIPADVDSVSIDRIEISGLSDVSETVVLGQMDIPEAGSVTAATIERDIDRIFSTRFFERVTYDLQPNSAGDTTLHIRVSERTEDEMRLGFRYDIRDQARFLVNTTFRNVASRGSKLSVEAEVGNKLSLTANYVLKVGARRRVGAFVRSQVLKSRFEEYLDAEPVSQISFRAARSEIGLGSVFSTRLHAGISVLAEYSHTAPRITELPDEAARTVFTFMPVATLWVDSFDRAAFPTRGIFLFARSLAAHTDFASDVSMSQHRVIGVRAVRVHPRVVLLPELELAITYGDRKDIPGPWRLGLGGENKGLYETGRFVGLDQNERTGKYLTKIGARVRFEIRPRRYVTFIGNIGSARDEWTWNVFEEDLVTGFGVGVEFDTVIGPIGLVLSAGNTNDLAISFNLGHRFATTY